MATGTTYQAKGKLTLRPSTNREAPRRRGSRSSRATASRPNVLGGALALLWFIVVAVPIYMAIKYSLQSRSGYLREGPLALPKQVNLNNYSNVLHQGFAIDFGNTVVVTVSSIAIVLGLSVPAAYAIVRSRGRLVSGVFRVFLMGLAVPAQAALIPLYLMMTRLGLYDSLIGIILPTAAFGLPIAILVLAGSLRDVPGEMYDAMSIDGAGPHRMFWSLVVPFGRSAITTVGIFTALNAWNGFIFPLVLTQSASSRVLTLGLYNFQGQYQTDVPALMAAVILSALPIFVVYIFGRRWLIGGLAGLGGK